MTPKEKLDKALGISSSDNSLDDFLSDLDIQKEDSQKAISQIEGAIEETITNIDSSLNDPNAVNDPEISKSIQQSLNDINDLVKLSKQIIQHLYNDIVSSELVDSELIASTASFIQATHENIKEYIELYRDRLKFFDTLKLEMVKHQNKIAEIELKHKLDMEKNAQNNPLGATPENMKRYDPSDIVEALKKMDNV